MCKVRSWRCLFGTKYLSLWSDTARGYALQMDFMDVKFPPGSMDGLRLAPSSLLLSSLELSDTKVYEP